MRQADLTREIDLVGGEEALARRCAELERKVAELEVSNEELSRFAAHAAHDLRAPIQAVAGFAELVARREGARLDEVSQGFLLRIFEAVATMRRLLDSTMEHGHASTGELHVAPVDCEVLLSEVMERLAPELDAVDATIEIRQLPVVFADRVQLGRVLQNLLSNSVKFRRPGEPPRIVVSGRRAARGWQLSVTDNGLGVAPSDQPRIFEPFHRGRETRGEGAGLGLAICKAVVERHGGGIWMEQVPGGGSRFTLFMPDPA